MGSEFATPMRFKNLRNPSSKPLSKHQTTAASQWYFSRGASEVEDLVHDHRLSLPFHCRAARYIQISALFPHWPPAQSHLHPAGGERHTRAAGRLDRRTPPGVGRGDPDRSGYLLFHPAEGL